MKHDILVIEADEPLAWLLVAILKPRFNPTVQRDGLSALSWLSKGNLPHLIICGDFESSRIDGLTFLQSLKQSGVFSDIPVIMVSSAPDKEFAEKCRLASASGVLKKPFDPLKLIQLIDRVLREAQREAIADPKASVKSY